MASNLLHDLNKRLTSAIVEVMIPLDVPASSLPTGVQRNVPYLFNVSKATATNGNINEFDYTRKFHGQANDAEGSAKWGNLSWIGYIYNDARTWVPIVIPHKNLAVFNKYPINGAINLQQRAVYVRRYPKRSILEGFRADNYSFQIISGMTGSGIYTNIGSSAYSTALGTYMRKGMNLDVDPGSNPAIIADLYRPKYYSLTEALRLIHERLHISVALSRHYSVGVSLGESLYLFYKTYAIGRMHPQTKETTCYGNIPIIMQKDLQKTIPELIGKISFAPLPPV